MQWREGGAEEGLTGEEGLHQRVAFPTPSCEGPPPLFAEEDPTNYINSGRGKRTKEKSVRSAATGRHLLSYPTAKRAPEGDSKSPKSFREKVTSDMN